MLKSFARTGHASLPKVIPWLKEALPVTLKLGSRQAG